MSLIPVVDLFAGPGGLGEGFGALDIGDRRAFRIVLSIEKEKCAHATLELRSFYRQFRRGTAPDDYYHHLRGRLSRDELFQHYPVQAALAREEAWHAELGNEAEFPNAEIDVRIRNALQGTKNWVLVGGPPCQAFSLAGRARLRMSDVANDPHERHELYTHYLRILAVHRPAVFVMENVRGLLSARIGGHSVFQRILEDLRNPAAGARDSDARRAAHGLRYKIYPIVDAPQRVEPRQSDGDVNFDATDFLVRTDEHGIPQARERVILLGIRGDLQCRPVPIARQKQPVPMWCAIRDLPPVRSALSRESDSGNTWGDAIRQITSPSVLAAGDVDLAVWAAIRTAIEQLRRRLDTGGEFVSNARVPEFEPRWFHDPRLAGACNHSARSHMASDLQRYLFAACWARVRGVSPNIGDMPKSLRPAHQNINGNTTECVFADRFRVQTSTRPSTTITSHIAKDGHYYIHPDPRQCRSLTVREAARLQTFPDNYLFCGPRTSQYHQVGNAVPPLFASRIARCVHNMLASNNR